MPAFAWTTPVLRILDGLLEPARQPASHSTHHCKWLGWRSRVSSVGRGRTLGSSWRCIGRRRSQTLKETAGCSFPPPPLYAI
eukprot:scaffold2945_cov244-Pinguiococcus_pyrenoidosus.AAC.2